ncbi:APC family permease [Planosporangium flavigriseum]|uniref:Putative amino acid permease n=1 Tax=Planosporangium flavigriseum TaxID=373681 RepID=A0A8J3LK29_9ACTN|nr:APC family permease [Planosporangium flavigriseum]NJC64934.1 APC family permease [Planosporangium flavigriseum]GIG72809.1 putative amino acid permease [Planosporangium flavigriseum]
MSTSAPPATPTPSPANKGLKLGALGLLSTVVIGVASAAPGYSLAATMGYIADSVGTKGPIIMLLAFVPMLFISYAYKALNSVDPDCGTSFTWVARVFSRRLGWMAGWMIVAADVIVMANLAQIAGQYTYDLFGLKGLAGNTWAVTLLGCVWILGMTWIAWRGVELSARTQFVLLGLELLALAVFAVVALVKVYAGSAGNLAIKPSLDWFNPFTGGITFGALSAGILLAVFIYWGWDTAVAVNEETENSTVTPGRAAVLATVVLLVSYVVITVAAQAYAGVGKEGIGMTNPDTIDDPLSGIGEAVLGGWGAKFLFLAVLSSAAASTQTTILPTARTTLAMGAYKALPKAFSVVHPRYQTPTVSTWAMGIVSVAFYAGLTWLSPASLTDLIAAIGLLIAFYYGLTGFASAWHFRKEPGRTAKDLWLKVILPFLGGVILVAAFFKSAYDYAQPNAGETTLFGIGGVFVLGIGSILLGIVLMIVWNAVSRAYFQGATMRAGVSIGEHGELITTAE